jgi:hypothetical protein
MIRDKINQILNTSNWYRRKGSGEGGYMINEFSNPVSIHNLRIDFRLAIKEKIKN